MESVYSEKFDPQLHLIKPFFADEKFLVQEYGSLDKFVREVETEHSKIFQNIAEGMLKKLDEIFPMAILILKVPGDNVCTVVPIDISRYFASAELLKVVPIYLRGKLLTENALREKFLNGDKIVSINFISEAWVSHAIIEDDKVEVLSLPHRPRRDPKKQDCVVVLCDYCFGNKTLYYEKADAGNLKPYNTETDKNARHSHLSPGLGEEIFGLFRNTAGLPLPPREFAKVKFDDEQ